MKLLWFLPSVVLIAVPEDVVAANDESANVSSSNCRSAAMACFGLIHTLLHLVLHAEVFLVVCIPRIFC